MTVSFHRYGLCFDHLGAYPFFPGTGELHDVGERHGKNYSVNVPLKASVLQRRWLHHSDVRSAFWLSTKSGLPSTLVALRRSNL